MGNTVEKLYKIVVKILEYLQLHTGDVILFLFTAIHASYVL